MDLRLVDDRSTTTHDYTPTLLVIWPWLYVLLRASSRSACGAARVCVDTARLLPKREQGERA